jgi:ComF family protein
MLHVLLDALFPKKSLSGGEGEWVTSYERSQLQSFPIVESASHVREHGIHHLDRLVSGSNYRQCPLLKNAIWTFKFRRIPALGGELAAILMSSSSLISPHAVLVPVPLHWTRRFWRGFNQSEILARIVSEQCHIPMENSLDRIRPTGFQSHRARKERLHALKDAFHARVPVPHRVILIDDVATTGATLDACAKTLKEAGAQWVEGWVVARG